MSITWPNFGVLVSHSGSVKKMICAHSRLKVMQACIVSVTFQIRPTKSEGNIPDAREIYFF